MPFIDYVEWLFEDDVISDYGFVGRITEAHTILSTHIMKEEDFLRGPHKKGQTYEDRQNYQPLFKGEWTKDQNNYDGRWYFDYNGEIMIVIKGQPLNDFLTQNPGLEYNEDYEIYRRGYLPQLQRNRIRGFN